MMPPDESASHPPTSAPGDGASAPADSREEGLDETLIFGNPATRRQFLKQAAGAGVAVTLAPHVFPGRADAAPTDAATTGAGGASGLDDVGVTLRINGQAHTLNLEPRVTLLDALRERLNLTGSKKGCDHGQCGACTVLVNGRRVNSCLTLAIMHPGDEITTIEGLADGDNLHPIQAAFIQHDGFQCGYCTPGQICSAVALLDEAQRQQVSHVTPDVRKIGNVELTDAEIRERMSGNLCRCGAYPNIVAAIKDVHAKLPAAPAPTPRA